MRWPLKALGDLARVSGGSTPSRNEDRYWNGKIPWVTPTDLPMPGTTIANVTDTKDHISNEGLASISAPLLPAGTVLFSSRATIGKLGIAQVPLSTNQGFANFEPKPGMDVRFLAYALQFFTPQISLLAGSTTFKEVSRGSIKKFKIPVPPPSEQQLIVKILDQADALRRLCAEAVAKAEGVVPALFQRMFGNAAPSRDKWPVKPIAELVEQRKGAIRTGPFGSQLHHAEFVADGVPVLGIDNVVTNRFRWTKARSLPVEKFLRFERYRVFPDDVLVTIMGTTGRVCVAPSDLPECISTEHLCVLSFDRAKVEPVYVWASLLFDGEVRGQVKSAGHGAIMEGWNTTIVKRLRLRQAPLDLQRDFVKRVQAVEALDDERVKCRAKIEELFRALMHRAFSGELTTDWREANKRELVREMEEQAKALSLSPADLEAAVQARGLAMTAAC